MNELQIFNNAEFGNIRSTLINETAWFVGRDVAEALGYENLSKAIRDHVDTEDKMMGVQNVTPSVIDSLGRDQHPTWINESGVYSLTFSSKLPKAREFKRWVTSEVLPAIRKTGRYESDAIKQQRLKEEADNISSQITDENWKYVQENIMRRYNISHLLLPSAETNLTAKLIVTDEKDKWAIDNAMKAYGDVYEYYRTTHDDRKIKEYVNLPGNQWLSTIGSAILSSALFIGRKAHVKWDSASPQMIFNCSSLRKDGCVTIPKIGAFAMDRKITLPPGKQLSMAIVEKEPDASYSITFKYK